MVQPIGVQAAKQERPSWSGRSRQAPRDGTGLWGATASKIDQPPAFLRERPGRLCMQAIAKTHRRHLVGGEHLSGMVRDAEVVVPKAAAEYEIRCCG